MGSLKTKAQSILTEKNTKIIPSNIKSGVTIFDVTGTYEGGGRLNIYVQTTAPSTYAGIWIKSNSFIYSAIREITSELSVVASNINILVKPNSVHNYKTILINSDIINGMNYEFDEVYLTDDNGDILYNSPEVYYGNGTQWVDITPQSYEIVPFATATDAQISALLDAHYRGDIDLSTIWNVGDTRIIHINALSAPVAGSIASHVAQDMTFRIIGFKHDNLTTPINGITKAAVTIECKELLGNNGARESDHLSGNSSGSYYENPSYWNNAYRRTWLNNNFVNALPSTFNALVKTVVKRNLNGHNTSSYVETNDKAFLLSYPEVFNSTWPYYRGNAALNDIEGTQYSYYNQNNTDASRIKYVNNNGSASSTASDYWLRSPSSQNNDNWCCVDSNGYANFYRYREAHELAPALSI